MEAAFVTFPFFLLIFGIMEMGFLFRNYLTISNTAAQGARAASVYGDDELADYQIMEAAQHGVSAMGLDKLSFMVVWEATGPNDTVPAACKTGGQSTGVLCNRFLPGDFILGPYDDPEDSDGDGDLEQNDNFGCVPGVSVDRFWCPTDREDSVSAGTDYVGIYVESEHVYLTGFLQNSSTLSSTKIIRIEPERN